ncbi:MAPK regulated corepressor interacting protein 2 [Anoplophora glabripennis]|nr:MAPK regulated corepressor interacting protein 2 [Anoplophora glabripennis]
MYNIKGPSKIVTKTTTRRGISQTIDNYRDHNKNKLIENDDYDSANVPKPVFHKKSSPNSQRQENISPQHEEIIKFIHESWNSVCLELDQENGDSDGSTSPQSEHSVCYYEDEPCVSLQDFKPFDLESWWGKRLYAYITSSVNTKN